MRKINPKKEKKKTPTSENSDSVSVHPPKPVRLPKPLPNEQEVKKTLTKLCEKLKNIESASENPQNIDIAPPTVSPQPGTSSDIVQMDTSHSQPGTSSQSHPPITTRMFTPVDNKKRRQNFSPENIPKKPITTHTTNRYTPLQNDQHTDIDDDDTDDDDTNTNTQTITKTKIKPPTPIIFPGKLEQPTQFIDTIKKIANNNFHIKHTSNTVSVFFNNKEDKDKYTTHINNNPDIYKYYTYTEKAEKSHAFVLRGLDSAPETQEIHDDLKRQGLTTRNIYKMRTTHRPLYLITTDNKTTLKDITHKIKFILYTKITWERHLNKKTLTQCHRCQVWGHATSNCRLDPRCLKCSDNHLTKECTIQISEKPTCANCGGDHTANSVTCPTYLRILEQKQKTLNKNTNITRKQTPQNDKPAFIPAPIPQSNVWTMRAERAMQQAPPTTSTTTADPTTTVPPLQRYAHPVQTQQTITVILINYLTSSIISAKK